MASWRANEDGELDDQVDRRNRPRIHQTPMSKMRQLRMHRHSRPQLQGAFNRALGDAGLLNMGAARPLGWLFNLLEAVIIASSSQRKHSDSTLPHVFAAPGKQSLREGSERSCDHSGGRREASQAAWRSRSCPARAPAQDPMESQARISGQKPA